MTSVLDRARAAIAREQTFARGALCWGRVTASLCTDGALSPGAAGELLERGCTSVDLIANDLTSTSSTFADSNVSGRRAPPPRRWRRRCVDRSGRRGALHHDRDVVTVSMALLDCVTGRAHPGGCTVDELRGLWFLDVFVGHRDLETILRKRPRFGGLEVVGGPAARDHDHQHRHSDHPLIVSQPARARSAA